MKVFMDTAGRKYAAEKVKSNADAEVTFFSETLLEILTEAAKPLTQAEIDEAVLAWPYREREKEVSELKSADAPGV